MRNLALNALNEAGSELKMLSGNLFHSFEVFVINEYFPISVRGAFVLTEQVRSERPNLAGASKYSIKSTISSTEKARQDYAPGAGPRGLGARMRTKPKTQLFLERPELRFCSSVAFFLRNPVQPGWLFRSEKTRLRQKANLG